MLDPSGGQNGMETRGQATPSVLALHPSTQMPVEELESNKLGSGRGHNHLYR